MLNVEGSRMPGESFSDIRRNRERRLADLIAERRLFVAWKPLCDAMTVHGKVNGFLPDKKIAKRVD